jgi:hypothetical protein
MPDEQLFEIVKYPTIGACGLSCMLCPNHNRDTKSKCPGCKTKFRFGAACPMLNCALKKKGVEFCWDCPEGETCDKWRRHRDSSKTRDSFICYQKLEDNIAFAGKHGVEAFEKMQNRRADILKELLNEFNDGRSKSYYCIAATVLEIEELMKAIEEGKGNSLNHDTKSKAKIMHKLIDDIAAQKGYILKLRK